MSRAMPTGPAFQVTQATQAEQAARAVRLAQAERAEHRKLVAGALLMGLVVCALFAGSLAVMDHFGGPSKVVQMITGSFHPTNTVDYSSRVTSTIVPQRSSRTG